jgi:hypothetical protein
MHYLHLVYNRRTVPAINDEGNYNEKCKEHIVFFKHTTTMSKNPNNSIRFISTLSNWNRMAAILFFTEHFSAILKGHELVWTCSFWAVEIHIVFQEHLIYVN